MEDKKTKKLMKECCPRDEPSDEIKLLNYNTYKEGYEIHKKANIKIFQFCLKTIPKEIIIDELKKKKIIAYDWRDEKFKTGSVQIAKGDKE